MYVVSFILFLDVAYFIFTINSSFIIVTVHNLLFLSFHFNFFFFAGVRFCQFAASAVAGVVRASARQYTGVIKEDVSKLAYIFH